MAEEFDFVDSTPSAIPLTEAYEEHEQQEHEEQVEEVVEEHVEEIEGEALLDVDGENVTVHEEIVDATPAPLSSFHFSALREYQTKHEEYLRQKAFKSQEKHQAILEKARADIDNFYKERALKRDKSEAANRSAETQFITDRDSNLAAGDSWDSVGKLTDLQAKPLGKDTSRMKQVLVQLKH